jgi:HPt (histidine-containing phosphotransfer) domain-containing protein
MESKECRYDIDALIKMLGVEFSDVSPLYLEYFFEMKENIQESKALCKEKDWNRLQRIVHNMKGISVSLNVNDLYAASTNLDIQLKKGLYDTVAQAIEDIQELFNAAELEIRDFFKQQGISI